MRTKQKHQCWACDTKTDHFVKVKRKVYFVKKFECLPKCFRAFDIERFQLKIVNFVSNPFPWLDIIKNPQKFKDLSIVTRKAQE